MPVYRLKILEKCDWCAKPAARAISTSGVSDMESSQEANSIRRWRTYSPSVHRKCLRNARARCAG